MIRPNQPSTRAEEEIRCQIALRGRITFREFMELALYHKSGGYYTNADKWTGAGDYYTSSIAHPAFGAAISMQLRAMWKTLGQPSPFTVVEMGSGSGVLAEDVLAYAERFDENFFNRLDYVAIELDQEPPFGVTGCVLSNELLDALPVARFQVVEGEFLEIFVAIDRDTDRLIEVLDQPETSGIRNFIASSEIPPVDGFRGEVNTGVETWTRRVDKILQRGFVVTIDYGGTLDELALRKTGTLQTYFNHVDGLSPYQNIGRQDITAHVNFTAVEDEGEKLGIRSLGLFSQTHVLERNGIQFMTGGLERMGLPLRELRINSYGVERLTRNSGLGGFRVLFQEKGTSVDSIDDVWPSHQDLTDMPLPPVLGPGHLRLAEGLYSPSSFELESLWSDSDDEGE